MRIVYRVTEPDYVAARDLFTTNERPLHRRYARRVMPWIGAFDLVMLAVYLIVVPRPDLGFVVVSGGVGVFLLYCGFALRRYFRKSYRKDHRFKNDFIADISETGIHMMTSFSDGHMKWNAFIRFLESDQIFLLFIAEWNFLIFPKRSFVPEEIEQFRSLLQLNIVSLG